PWRSTRATSTGEEGEFNGRSGRIAANLPLLAEIAAAFIRMLGRGLAAPIGVPAPPCHSGQWRPCDRLIRNVDFRRDAGAVTADGDLWNALGVLLARPAGARTWVRRTPITTGCCAVR